MPQAATPSTFVVEPGRLIVNVELEDTDDSRFVMHDSPDALDHVSDSVEGDQDSHDLTSCPIGAGFWGLRPPSPDFVLYD